MDNGPEMTANALRDWCRFSGTERSFIEPGTPWQNRFVESFGSRVRDECSRSRHSTPCSRRNGRH
jgi:putative transposase